VRDGRPYFVGEGVCADQFANREFGQKPGDLPVSVVEVRESVGNSNLELMEQ
jgi:hypothetical protein